MPKNEGFRSRNYQLINQFTNHLDFSDGARLEYDPVRLEEDFNGDQLDPTWNVFADGAGGGLVRVANNGIFELRTGGANDDTVQLSHQTNWRCADEGTSGLQTDRVVFEAIVAIATITTVNVQVGFADQIWYAGQRLPFADPDVPNAFCADAVVIGFDTDGAVNTNLTGLANANGTTQALDLTDAFVAGEYIALRIEIDVLGNADFYINGTYRGTIATAVTPETLLTPYIGIQERAGQAVRNIGIDYVRCYKSRNYTGQTFAATTTTTSSSSSTTSSSSSTSSSPSSTSSSSSTSSTSSSSSTTSSSSSTSSTPP